MHDKYEDKNTQNVIFLRRRFLNAKQESNENVEEYIDRIELIKEELEAISANNISEEDAVRYCQDCHLNMIILYSV